MLAMSVMKSRPTETLPRFSFLGVPWGAYRYPLRSLIIFFYNIETNGLTMISRGPWFEDRSWW